MEAAANLDKQIKRHVIGRTHRFYAVTAPGLEEICARELAPLSDTIRIDRTAPGGVSFNGRLDDLMRANLHLRTAGRVLMRLEAFKATNFRQLAKRAAAVPWNRYLPAGSVPRCSVTTHRSRLYHTRAVAERLTDAIGQYWRNGNTPSRSDTGQTLHVRIEQDIVTLSLDGSGANLYRRGLKTHAARAPLRETLAAGILCLAGYRPDQPLVDPMCGSGTFSLEAALMAKQVAPGRHREFAFMQWPAFRPRRWDHLTKLADGAVRACPRPIIFASDEDEAACHNVAAAIRRFELGDAVRVDCIDFFAFKPQAESMAHSAPGLVVLNPPYGRRLAADRNPMHLYRRIGQKLHDDFKGWRAAVLLPRNDLIRTLPFGSESIALVHGGLTLYLQMGTIE